MPQTRRFLSPSPSLISPRRPKSTSAIEELIVELKKSVTMLLVTHNMAQAARVSDYTAFIYLGELVEFGTTEKMFTVPKDKRTEEYLTGKFG